MNGILKVDPQKLINTANSFKSTNSKIDRSTKNMLTIIDKLNSTWKGEASTTYNKKFHQLENDMQKMHRMIDEHVNDLNEMAKQYIKAENTNIDTGNSLAGDVIS